MTGQPPPSHKTCLKFSLQELNDFTEGLLPPARHEALIQHLPGCPTCDAEIAGRIYVSELKLKPEPEPSAAETREYEAFRARLERPPEPEVQLEIGDTIGPFEIVGKIGKGGSSTVYECIDTIMQRSVALKIINTRFFDNSSLSRLEREARTLARLNHPGIVKAYDTKPYHYPPYIVMELVAGGAAGKLIAKNTLPPTVAARLVASVADAVQHAHDQGIVHRDIKPSNLLVVQPIDPEKPLPAELTLKVSDFGLARPMGNDSRLTSTNAIVGTPAYMSPEQTRGKQGEIGPATDIYSIGVVLYEFLIARPPLVAENTMQTLRMVNEVEPVPPRLVRPGIPRDLDTICMKCLRKEPAERYTSARELADDLQRFLEGRPILARPIGPLSRLYRWCNRNKALAASLMGILTLLSSLLALAITFAFVENDLRQKVEASATLYKNAATEAGLESDAFRTLLFSGIGSLSNFAGELENVQNHRDAVLLSTKAKDVSRNLINSYSKRHTLQKEVKGDRIDLWFRDAMALRNVGFVDQSMTMLNRICELAYKTKPGDEDYLLLISAGNRSAQSIGRILIDQQRRDEARAVMHKAWKSISFDPDMPGIVPLNLAERISLLTTLLTTIDNLDTNPTATEIKAELESLSRRSKAALARQNAQKTATVKPTSPGGPSTTSPK
ncbi:MAG: serine/threonine-protein kinase [Planctomycetota bacterium]